MNELVPLHADQYLLIKNIFSLSVATFGGFALLFILLRRNVAPAYSIAVSMMAAIMAMAGYHYFRIYENWGESFVHQTQGYIPTGLPFSYGYRYADWLGTVPLLVTAIVLVLDLGRQKSASMISRLVISSILMIALGYVGEAETSNMVVRAVWGAASTVPFLYIVYILWAEMTQVLGFESERVRSLFSGLRFMLLASWGFYPIVYMFPMFGLGGSNHLELIQLGNSAADLLAKVGVGLMILAIAREKTEEDIAAGRTTVSLNAAAD
jgi:bacteriorhodopsin